MFGFKDPVIIERSWRMQRETSAEQFAKNLAYAEEIHARVHEVRFDDPNGKPVVVVWVAGQRAGRLFNAYEITQRPTWQYSHTGWSAHNDGAGERRWWLAYYADGKRVRTLGNGRGNLIRFKSYLAAFVRATELNDADGIASGEGE